MNRLDKMGSLKDQSIGFIVAGFFGLIDIQAQRHY